MIFGGTDCAKAGEAKEQTISSKGRRALLIAGSLLKPCGVDLGRRHCPSSPHNSKIQKLCLILIAITSNCANEQISCSTFFYGKREAKFRSNLKFLFPAQDGMPGS